MGNTTNTETPVYNNSHHNTAATKHKKPLKRFDPNPNYLRPSNDPNDWNNSSSMFGILPPEIIVEIFLLLGVKELATLSRSCKKTREIAYDYDKFWEAYMDMGLKRYEVTDELAIDVISKFGPVKSNWNFAICEQIHNETLDYLNRYCSNIAVLNLASCRNITDAGIMQFTDKFASLTELNLANIKISAEGLQHIVKHAPKLRKLCLKSIGVSDLLMLEELHNLTELDLSNACCQNYQTKFPVIPSLKTLIIPKFKLFFGSYIDYSVQASKQTPEDCGSRSFEKELVDVLKSLPNLTALDISYSTNFVLSSLDTLHLQSLTVKGLDDMYRTTPDFKKTLQALSSTLTYLDLSEGRENMSWFNMILFAVENCSNLRTLKINNNHYMTRRIPQLFELIYEHPNLNYLEGYGYVFDYDKDEKLVQKLRRKPGGMKVTTDGL